MTVSSGYENKGYDGDNPVKVWYIMNTISTCKSELSLNHFYFTASIAKHRRYRINQRESEVVAVGKMENIEKRGSFVISVYDTVHSFSGNYCSHFMMIAKLR